MRRDEDGSARAATVVAVGAGSADGGAAVGAGCDVAGAATGWEGGVCAGGSVVATLPIAHFS